MTDDLATWLRGVVTADRDSANARLRRQMSDDYRRQVWEKAKRAEAELAVLDEHRPAPGRDQPEGDLAQICWVCADDRMYGYPYPCRTVRLLGSGYRHRPGYLEEWKP